MLRSLGHATLCGALYVVYRSARTVTGEYMLCALFQRCLVLARPVKARDGKFFQVVAGIDSEDIKLESTENGKGMYNKGFWRLC